MMNFGTQQHNDWQIKLYQKHDILFQEHKLSPSETCMCWGLDVQAGWQDLVSELCEQLQNIMDDNKGIYIIAKQVKEKFACLHFYYDVSYPKDMPTDKMDILDRQIQKIVCAYEEKSMTVCEWCGNKQAKQRPYGWRVVLCDACDEKKKAGGSPEF